MPTPTNPWLRWLLDATERALRTFAQGFVAVITVDAFTDFSSGWDDMLLIGALAGLYSILMSLAAKPSGAEDSASYLPHRMDPPQDAS